MVTYAREEMVGITELTKSLGKYLDKVVSHRLNKLAIVRRNEPEAVIIPIEEYEYMRKMADIAEDMEIAETIKKRMLDPKNPPKFISHEEMMERLRKAGYDV
jgi:prevent-host-death family protein